MPTRGLVDRHWPGRFIVLEGVDGSGTTTHARRLAKTLKSRGVDTHLTCEPTGGPIGMLLRQVLQNRIIIADSQGTRPLAWSTMALLFAADRLDHLDSVVLPALRRGATVVSDRYYLSSLAYQSVTAADKDQALPWIRQINGRAIRPDLTLVLDVPAEVAEKRRVQRGGAQELFEGRGIQERLVQVYANAETLVPKDHVVHVDSVASIEEVGERILAAVSRLYERTE